LWNVKTPTIYSKDWASDEIEESDIIFIDGNGRAARLPMNLALLQAGYPLAIIPPILRVDYLDTLDQTHKGDAEPFISFTVRVCYETAKEYLRLLEG